MPYFSDREKGRTEPFLEELNLSVWNGIVSVYEKYIKKNAFSGNFAVVCKQGQGVYGCDVESLQNAIKAEIPTLEIPIKARNSEYDKIPDKYDILDFIEFCYKNITDAYQGKLHSYFNDHHHHYTFRDNGENKEKFREDINTIFYRNNIAFYLDEYGLIKRNISEFVKGILDVMLITTSDQRLNELLRKAYEKFILPKMDDRKEALEKIWDAFERLKTYYEENKKKSGEKLVDEISKGDIEIKKIVENEFKLLTEIGNNFQIRHFEKGKHEIKNSIHVDYLFMRILATMVTAIKTITPS